MEWLPAKTVRDKALLRSARQQHKIAQRIIRERDAKMLTTEQLADRADLHPDTVRAILNGSTHATLAVLSVLSDAVGLRFAAVSKPPDDSPGRG